MADKQKVIEIKTGDAIKNIQDLKNNIKQLKENLSTLDIGTAAYKETLNELQENQAALRNAMHATSADFNQVMDAATAANVAFDENNNLVKAETLSYNELVRELDVLKQQWRATTDEAERAQLGERVNNVNNRLKEMDASVGVFGRNVGNYIGAVDHLTAGMSNMGKGAAGIVAPLKGVTTGLKTMSATPAIAILGLLANLLDEVMKALKGNEEQTQQLTAAMAPFQAIGDLLTKTLQAIAGVVVKLIEGFSKLTQAIFGTNKATQDRIALAEKEKDLAQQTRQTIIANAEAERDVAELRAKSTDRLNYTAKERLAFLEQAGDKEKEIAARALQDAKLQYEIIKAKNALAKSSARDLDAEAQAYAAMVKAETDYYNQVRTINAGIIRTRREEAKAARDAAKAVKDAATAKITAEKDYLTQLLSIVKTGTESELKIQNSIAKKEYELAVANAKQKITDAKELNKALELLQKSYQVKLQKNQQDHDNKVKAQELQAIANRRDALQKGSVMYAAAQEEYAQKALDGLKRQMDETDAEFEARRLAALRAVKEAQNATADAILTETQDTLKAQMAGLAEGSVEALQVSLEMAKANLDGLYQGIDESDDAFLARRLEAEKAVRQAEDALEDGKIDHDRLILENRLGVLEEGSIEYLTRALELKQFELDSLHQLEGESEEEFRARQLAAEKDYIAAKKALWQQAISIYQGVASATSGILGSIADMYENNTDATEAEQKKAKNLRIAGATIDMLSGVVSAISTAQSLGPIAGPIMAAINSAAVIAAGVANISKIKAQQISKSGSSTATPSVPVAVEAPSVVPEVQEVHTLTGAQEEERLNQPQRVYILSSDLEADRNATRVQVEETTF